MNKDKRKDLTIIIIMAALTAILCSWEAHGYDYKSYNTQTHRYDTYSADGRVISRQPGSPNNYRSTGPYAPGRSLIAPY